MFKQETKEFNLSEKKFHPKISTWWSRCFPCQGRILMQKIFLKIFNLWEEKYSTTKSPPIEIYPVPGSNIHARNLLQNIQPSRKRIFNKKIPTWRSRCFQCQGQSQVIQPEPQVFPQCTQKICKGYASKNIVNNI